MVDTVCAKLAGWKERLHSVRVAYFQLKPVFCPYQEQFVTVKDI